MKYNKVVCFYWSSTPVICQCSNSSQPVAPEVATAKLRKPLVTGKHQ